MRTMFLALAAVLLAISPALAQVPTDRDVEQAQARVFAAQAEFYNLAARKLQAELAASQKGAADTAAWWAAWWAGMFRGAAK